MIYSLREILAIPKLMGRDFFQPSVADDRESTLGGGIPELKCFYQLLSRRHTTAIPETIRRDWWTLSYSCLFTKQPLFLCSKPKLEYFKWSFSDFQLLCTRCVAWAQQPTCYNSPTFSPSRRAKRPLVWLSNHPLHHRLRSPSQSPPPPLPRLLPIPLRYRISLHPLSASASPSLPPQFPLLPPFCHTSSRALLFHHLPLLLLLIMHSPSYRLSVSVHLPRFFMNDGDTDFLPRNLPRQWNEPSQFVWCYFYFLSPFLIHSHVPLHKQYLLVSSYTWRAWEAAMRVTKSAYLPLAPFASSVFCLALLLSWNPSDHGRAILLLKRSPPTP